MCPNRSAILPDGGGTDQSCGADFLNGPHTIKHSEGNVLLEIGTNPPFARVDDPEHIMIGADALIQTGVDANGVPIFAVPPFHQGTTAPGVTPARPIAEQIRVSFPKKGRYLAICMNRAHSFNDWMFAFIDVVGSDGDQ